MNEMITKPDRYSQDVYIILKNLKEIKNKIIDTLNVSEDDVYINITIDDDYKLLIECVITAKNESHKIYINSLRLLNDMVEDYEYHVTTDDVIISYKEAFDELDDKLKEIKQKISVPTYDEFVREIMSMKCVRMVAYNPSYRVYYVIKENGYITEFEKRDVLTNWYYDKIRSDIEKDEGTKYALDDYFNPAMASAVVALFQTYLRNELNDPDFCSMYFYTRNNVRRLVFTSKIKDCFGDNKLQFFESQEQFYTLNAVFDFVATHINK